MKYCSCSQKLPKNRMSATTTLLTILGGVGVTLYGVAQIRDGVMQACGAQLRALIEKSTRYRLSAFGTGIVVTALIQSATATAMIVASFAGRKLITIPAALAVLLGADVGTTLVAQVFSFGGGPVGPVLVFAGITITTRAATASRLKHVGTVLVGLGLLLIGLHTITQAAAPLRESEIVKDVMQSLGADLPMAFLLGALLTWLAQSSLAMVLLVMSFATGRLLEIDTAFALVLGSQVGAAVTPLLVHFNRRDDAHNVVLGSFLIRLLFCFVCLPLIDPLLRHVHFLGNDVARQVVNFHTALSVLRAVIFLPVLSPIAALLQKVWPESKDPNDPSQPRYLDMRDLTVPSVALAAAVRESLRLGDQVLHMLDTVPKLFLRNNPHMTEHVHELDNHVDRLYEQIKFFLAKLARESLDEKQARRHMDLLMFVTNLEHVGDIIVKSLAELARKKWRHNISFSEAGWAEIAQYHMHVAENFRLAMHVFNSEDILLARQLVQQKEAMRVEANTSAGGHFARLSQGLLESLGSSSVHLDVIRDLRRINDHLTTVAYNILEANGALQSRLKSSEAAA